MGPYETLMKNIKSESKCEAIRGDKGLYEALRK